MTRFIARTTKGFTLLETLASITILTFVIVGPLSVISSSSSYARSARNVLTARYLADEAVDLVQNRYDSWYIYCKNYTNASVEDCVPLAGETSGQSAWRLFTQSFQAVNGQPSCYISDNQNGCAYDYLHMNVAATATPVRYVATGTECPYLIEVATTTPLTVQAGQGDSPHVVQITSKTYMCKGVPSHTIGTVASTSMFTRTVTLERLSGVDVYNDDVLISAVVSFKGVNGVTRTSTSTRFLHARS